MSMPSPPNSSPVPVVSHTAVQSGPLDAKIAVRKLDFFYGGTRALKNVNLTLYANRVTAIVGPSGCGKSTLLRVLNRVVL